MDGELSNPVIPTNATTKNDSQAALFAENTNGNTPKITKLAKEYARVSQLVSKLDAEVRPFVKQIGTLVDVVPAHDGLAALLDSYGETQGKVAPPPTSFSTQALPKEQDGCGHAKKRKRSGTAEKDDQYDVVMGDEAIKTNDDLVLL